MVSTRGTMLFCFKTVPATRRYRTKIGTPSCRETRQNRVLHDVHNLDFCDFLLALFAGRNCGVLENPHEFHRCGGVAINSGHLVCNFSVWFSLPCWFQPCFLEWWGKPGCAARSIPGCPLPTGIRRIVSRWRRLYSNITFTTLLKILLSVFLPPVQSVLILLALTVQWRVKESLF